MTVMMQCPRCNRTSVVYDSQTRQSRCAQCGWPGAPRLQTGRFVLVLGGILVAFALSVLPFIVQGPQKVTVDYDNAAIALVGWLVFGSGLVAVLTEEVWIRVGYFWRVRLSGFPAVAYGIFLSLIGGVCLIAAYGSVVAGWLNALRS